MKMLEHGTTTVEAKSGYGLSTEEELRELRLIKRLSGELPLDVVPTFMGAHSIPREYTGRREEYVDSVIGEMLPQVNRLGLASFVDVFCEEGAFTLNETARILSAAKEMGFGLKLHGEEFTRLGSALMAAKMGAVSVDHLLRLSDGDISEIARTGTIFTLMPGTLFFLGYHEYAPARKIIDAGGSVCLATDFNAGSCMSRSMQMAMSLGCIAMKMTPGEAITAATYNGAYAVGMGDMAGSIQEGKQADLVVFSVDDYRMIPYHFGENLVKMVIKKGQVVLER
jgi:imidazolonepropionase